MRIVLVVAGTVACREICNGPSLAAKSATDAGDAQAGPGELFIWPLHAEEVAEPPSLQRRRVGEAFGLPLAPTHFHVDNRLGERNAYADIVSRNTIADLVTHPGALEGVGAKRFACRHNRSSARASAAPRASCVVVLLLVWPELVGSWRELWAQGQRGYNFLLPTICDQKPFEPINRFIDDVRLRDRHDRVWNSRIGLPTESVGNFVAGVVVGLVVVTIADFAIAGADFAVVSIASLAKFEWDKNGRCDGTQDEEGKPLRREVKSPVTSPAENALGELHAAAGAARRVIRDAVSLHPAAGLWPGWLHGGAAARGPAGFTGEQPLETLPLSLWGSGKKSKRWTSAKIGETSCMDVMLASAMVALPVDQPPWPASGKKSSKKGGKKGGKKHPRQSSPIASSSTCCFVTPR
ncbi:hypothetical protein MAPG_10498 [Magnaporthiopsis poae ATCC 64411]|uniref:Uncharacterized protein n=1 Tax=Magnaporthiopsis poae (strain ATCC 64411 / 73-15) TaxID=644358 RepID=A0A0C4ECR5_MAGP6|nr:hypothetical protein MAPG_10498 [Magnaporthiopsis poae ATCC 64411]